MKEIFEFAVDVFLTVFQGGYYHLLYVLCIGVILCLPKVPRTYKVMFLAYTGVFLVLYFFPVTAKIIIACVGSDVYWRMFWLLPIPILIGYAGVYLITCSKRKMVQAAAALICIGILAVSGLNIYRGGAFSKAHNLQKLSQECILICDQMEADSGGGNIKVVVPDALVTEIRQYDAGIQMPYGRYLMHLTADSPEVRLHEQMIQPLVDSEMVADLVRENNCNYLVLLDEQADGQSLEQLGYQELGRAGGYILYKDISIVEQ